MSPVQVSDSDVGAQRIVTEILRRLPPGHEVLRDLDIPGYRAKIDHLVIGPTGVFMIGAKKWGGQLTAGKGMLWRGRHPIHEECVRAEWEANQLSVVVGQPVTPILCFVDTVLPAPVQRCGKVTVCSDDAVLDTICAGRVVLEADTVGLTADRGSCLVRATPVGATPAVANPSIGAAPTAPGPDAPARLAAPAGPVDDRRFGMSMLRLGVIAAALIVGIACIPLVSRQVARGIANALPRAASPAVTAPAKLTPPTVTIAAATATTTAAAATTTPTSVTFVVGAPVATTFTPPTVVFMCPAAGAGWSASLTATEFRFDPDGFAVWYADASGAWIPWGRFSSDSTRPSPLGGIPAGQPLMIKTSRGPAGNPALIADATTFVTPDGAC